MDNARFAIVLILDFTNTKMFDFKLLVPGGVGPMTVAMLISNTVNAARLQTQPIQKS